jgi:hypothetical protein
VKQWPVPVERFVLICINGETILDLVFLPPDFVSNTLEVSSAPITLAPIQPRGGFWRFAVDLGVYTVSATLFLLRQPISCNRAAVSLPSFPA